VNSGDFPLLFGFLNDFRGGSQWRMDGAFYNGGRGADGKQSPRLYQVGRAWAYSYTRAGGYREEEWIYPTYGEALRAAIDAYCSSNPSWRLRNKVTTYRNAADLLGIPTEPPSKAEELRALREAQANRQKNGAATRQT
jgi:hypothetical protein